jgi:hypothetical protein
MRIETALDESTTLEFVETPLADVVDYLKHLHDIEIQLDKRALDDVGIGTDTPVTHNLKGISLRSALRLILRELDLAHILRDEVLLITTPEKARHEPVTRVYCVAELLEFGTTAKQLAEALVLVFRLEHSDAAQPQIVPHEQTLIVSGSIEDHGNLEWLLQCLHRAVHDERANTQSASTSGAGQTRACGRRRRGKVNGRPANPLPWNRFDRTVQGPTEAKIEAALLQPTTVQFVETPLQDVVDFLKDQHGIEIQIDTRALEDVGIGSDSPVTIQLKGVSLRSALRLTLRQLDLTFVIRDEVLLISTPAEAQVGSVTRVYSAAELLDFRQRSDELAKNLAEVLSLEAAPPVAVKARSGETKKKASPPKLRIVPFRQAIILVGDPAEHETLCQLLDRLSLGLQATTHGLGSADGVSPAGSTTSRQRLRKPRSKKPDDSVDESSTTKRSRKRSGRKDPVARTERRADSVEARSVDSEDPFGDPASPTDPFGGGGKKEDPFGGENGAEDPFD